MKIKRSRRVDEIFNFFFLIIDYDWRIYKIQSPVVSMKSGSRKSFGISYNSGAVGYYRN